MPGVPGEWDVGRAASPGLVVGRLGPPASFGAQPGRLFTAPARGVVWSTDLESRRLDIEKSMRGRLVLAIILPSLASALRAPPLASRTIAARSSPRPRLLQASDNGESQQQQTGVASEASVAALKFYKAIISPLIPKSCRFIPTCSEYGAVAFARYPPWQASTLTAWRLLRCNPLHVKGCGCGGDDPVWPPVAYWAGDGRIRTYIDDEISRARANGEDVEPLAWGGEDPLGLLQDREDGTSSQKK